MRSVLLVLALGACGGHLGAQAPAAEGVRQLVAALHDNDPHEAYKLLSSDERKRVSFDEFALQWKQTDRERAWQAKRLEESLKGNPDVGERALVSFSDGKLVSLEREGKTWRLESELVSRSRAKQPRDAIRLFADAIGQRDIAGVLGVLTTRRREGLQRQIEGFIAGIQKNAGAKLEQPSADRAELSWDENGIRYRVVLRKEDDEWRVDDIYIRPVLKDDEPSEKSIEPIPEDF